MVSIIFKWEDIKPDKAAVLGWLQNLLGGIIEFKFMLSIFTTASKMASVPFNPYEPFSPGQNYYRDRVSTYIIFKIKEHKLLNENLKSYMKKVKITCRHILVSNFPSV